MGRPAGWTPAHPPPSRDVGEGDRGEGVVLVDPRGGGSLGRRRHRQGSIERAGGEGLGRGRRWHGRGRWGKGEGVAAETEGGRETKGAGDKELGERGETVGGGEGKYREEEVRELVVRRKRGDGEWGCEGGRWAGEGGDEPRLLLLRSRSVRVRLYLIPPASSPAEWERTIADST